MCCIHIVRGGKTLNLKIFDRLILAILILAGKFNSCCFNIVCVGDCNRLLICYYACKVCLIKYADSCNTVDLCTAVVKLNKNSCCTCLNWYQGTRCSVYKQYGRIQSFKAECTRSLVCCYERVLCAKDNLCMQALAHAVSIDRNRICCAVILIFPIKLNFFCGCNCSVHTGNSDLVGFNSIAFQFSSYLPVK